MRPVVGLGMYAPAGRLVRSMHAWYRCMQACNARMENYFEHKCMYACRDRQSSSQSLKALQVLDALPIDTPNMLVSRSSSKLGVCMRGCCVVAGD